MAAAKIPQFQPPVENSAKRIYGTGYEVPCMNEHLEIDFFLFKQSIILSHSCIYRKVLQDGQNNGLNCYFIYSRYVM